MNDDLNIKPVLIEMSGLVIYRDQITPTQAGQIIAFLDSKQHTPELNVSEGAFQGAPGGRTLGASAAPLHDSLSQAIEEANAQTNAEKIVVLANFVMREEQLESFTTHQIRPMFQRAGEPTPRNLTRDILQAKRVGLIAESKEGTYYITNKGRDALTQGFQLRGGGFKKSRKSTSTPKRSKRSPMSLDVSDTIMSLDLQKGVDGALSFHDLGPKRDRLLWLVAFAKNQSVEGLSNTEVVFLSNAIGDPIPANNINGYFKPNRAKGYLFRNLTDQKIRITPKGEEYLRSLNSLED